MKLSTIKKSTLIYFIFILILAAIIGFSGGYLVAGNKLTSNTFAKIVVSLTFFSTVSTLPLFYQWWLKIDEAAREAHKAAWFWGGGIGIIFAIFFAFLNILFDNAILDGLIRIPFGCADLGRYGFEIGMYLTVSFASIGYIIHWLFWWRKMGALNDKN